MRPCTPLLDYVLRSNDPRFFSLTITDLYTFRLIDGLYLWYSGWNAALSLPSAAFPAGSLNAGTFPVLYFPLGPKFSRSKTTNKIGVEPASLDIDVYASVSDLVGTLTFAQAAKSGLFDGAIVELDRFFALPTQQPENVDPVLGCMIWFYGKVADIDISRSKVSLKVKSMMNLLAVQQMPRRIFSQSCTHVFGDAMCGYDRTNGVSGGHADGTGGTATGIGRVDVAAQSGSGGGMIVLDGTFVPNPDFIYNEGTVIGVSGANHGQFNTISSVQNNIIYGFRPWVFPIAVGDVFAVFPGCDHTTNTCQNHFQNIHRYGGMPYIPPPEFAL